VASKDGRPIAAILTIRFKHALVYKYGGSDSRFNNPGMQFLLWRTIEEGKEAQLSEFDMGRSDCDDVGLVAFKDRWAAARCQLDYFRYPARYWSSYQKTSAAVIESMSCRTRPEWCLQLPRKLSTDTWNSGAIL
jgi:lipid II:glycine glycyltransferase (peptidoglycan interpeptide bridge formation enzyme)